MTNLIEGLQWRYASKSYDTMKKVSQENLDNILEAMRLSPSSLGLQPYKFIVVQDPSLRTTLRKHSRDQPQVTDASHLIVLFTKDEITEEDINNYLQNMSKTRNIDIEDLDEFKKMILGASQRPDIQARNSRQTYITLGIGIAAASELHIDSSPMEGFDVNAYNEILQIKGYSASAILAIGYRNENDEKQYYPKVRKHKDEIIVIK